MGWISREVEKCVSHEPKTGRQPLTSKLETITVKSKLMKAGILFAFCGTLAAVDRIEAQGGNTASCATSAGNSFVNCVDEHLWFVAPLCALRYNAELLLCGAASKLKR